MKKHPFCKMAITIVLAVALLVQFIPVECVFAAWTTPNNITINDSTGSADVRYFVNQYGTPQQTNMYYVAGQANTIAYCIDAESTGPGGTAYALDDAAIDATYRAGLARIAQYGYPTNSWKGYGISASEAQYATQAAMHWWQNAVFGGTIGWVRAGVADNGCPTNFAGTLGYGDWLLSLAGNHSSPYLFVGIDPGPSAWSAGSPPTSTFSINGYDCDTWTVNLPAGVTCGGASTVSGTGNQSITVQLTNPTAFAASSKQVTAEGFSDRMEGQIHYYVAGGGYQNMVVYQQSVNAVGDPAVAAFGAATGDISIHKVTQQNSGAQVPEMGAIFQVYSVSPPALISVLTTDANGNATVSNIPSGDYNVHQAFAPAGTILAPDQIVAVTGGAVAYGNFINSTTYFNIAKTDQDTGAPVAGAQITIYQGGTPVASGTTGAGGNATFESIPAGNYTWQETAAPAGYILNTATYSFSLDANGSVTGTTTFTDDRSDGHIEVYKTTTKASGAVQEPGAVFQLFLTSAGFYDAAPAASRDQITTDANGHAISKILAYGNYTMVQTAAPVGTVLNPTVWKIDVGTNGAGAMIANDLDTVNAQNTPTFGRLEIVKTTNRGYSVLEAGASFEVYSTSYASYTAAPAEYKDTITTDVAGYAITKALPYGVYSVHQTVMPAGTKSSADFTATLGTVDGDVIHSNLVNQTYWGDIQILKYKSAPSSTTGILTPESDASFRIYPSSFGTWDAAMAALTTEQKASLTDTITSNIGGVARTNHKLPYGEYTVEQIDTIANLSTFKVDAWPVMIGAADNQTYTYVRNNEIYEQYLSVIKTDIQTGKVVKIAGATFQILADDGVTTLSDTNGVDSFVTDANGRTDIKDLALQVGNYFVKETKAPLGYVLDTDLKAFAVSITDHGSSTVTIDYGVDVRDIVFADVEQTCQLIVEKQGDFLTTATQVDAINADRDVQYSDEQGNALLIYNFGYTDAAKPGAVFEVFVGETDIRDGDGLFRMYDADGDGTAEVELSAGTSMGTITTEAVLQPDGSTRYLASLSALPLDAVTGTAQYVLQEVTAPTGDLINPDKLTYDFTYSDQTLAQIDQEQSITDTRQKVQFTVEKQKEAGTWNKETKSFDWPLVAAPGILFGLFTTNDILDQDGSVLVATDTLVDVLCTDARGLGKTTQDLPFGDYYIKEVNVTEDVIMDAATTYDITTAPLVDQTVSIASFAINKGTAIVNRQIAGTMEIYKIAADTQLPMMGVVFEVYDAAANLVDTVTTGIDGHTQTKVLPFGAYTLIETKTVTGYALADKQSFSIYLTPHDGEIFSEAQMTVVDQKMAQVEVFKVTADGTQTPMNGVVFGVFDAKTNLQIASTTTDKDGHGVLYVLAGNYYLQELKTWDGYSLSSERIPITAEFAHLYTFRQTNTLTELRVTKISTSGTPLAGMQFTVTNKETGQLISFVYDAIRKGYVATSVFRETPDPAVVATTLITGTDGTALILGLVEGEYIVTEIVAPAGYNLDSKPTDTTIGTRTSGVLGASVTIKNSPVTAKTGEIGNNYNLISAALCCLGLATAVLIILRDRKGKREKQKDQK